MKKKFVLGLISCLVIGGAYVVKAQQLRQERNLAIRKIQEQASKYIIENYEGIKKIEWRGWGVTPLSNTLTAMTINDYPLNESAEGLFSYNANGEKYIEKYTDAQFDVTPFAENKDTMDIMQKTLREQGVKKGSKGSPTAKVIYNWQESK